MNSKGTWAAFVAPVLAVLGLLLAALAWPGVSMTAHLVMRWTYQVGDLIQRHPEAQTVRSGAQGDRRTREASQRRSLLLFRFAPPIFLGVWVIVLICSLVLRS